MNEKEIKDRVKKADADIEENQKSVRDAQNRINQLQTTVQQLVQQQLILVGKKQGYEEMLFDSKKKPETG